MSAGETRGTEVPYRVTVRDYMMQETVGFIGELIKQNKSVLNIIDSDFAYLNERLAIHYGIDGVKGMKMRRADQARGQPRWPAHPWLGAHRQRHGHSPAPDLPCGLAA